MGLLNGWPLDAFTRDMASEFGLDVAVETGTFEGNGAAWAATVFRSVVSIEIRADYRDVAAAKYAHLPIDFLCGSSADLLPGVVRSLSGPAFFWLDAHAGGGHYGAHDDCPLLAELEAIAGSSHNHFVVIDDARAFLAPPPPPFDSDCWPNICDVLDAARLNHPKYCVVIADAIICVPSAARPIVERFCASIRPTV